jgi:hypothetical protein
MGEVAMSLMNITHLLDSLSTAKGINAAETSPHVRLSRLALVGFQGRGCAEVVHPDCGRCLLLKALLGQEPSI